MAAGGQFRNNCFSRSSGFEITIVIREAHDRIRITDIDVLWIVAERVKCDSEVIAQTRAEDFLFLWFTVTCYATKNKDLAKPAFRHKHIAIGSSTNFTRFMQTFRIALHSEAGQSLRPGIIGLWNQSRRV